MWRTVLLVSVAVAAGDSNGESQAWIRMEGRDGVGGWGGGGGGGGGGGDESLRGGIKGGEGQGRREESQACPHKNLLQVHAIRIIIARYMVGIIFYET